MATKQSYRPQEHGFWDYTTPAAGGMEHYRLDDYRWLLDDMQRAGMNSLAMVIKWFTTGYRSRLPFLDQNPRNPMIASDNRFLHAVLAEADQRGINIWLAAVVSMFPADKMKSRPWAVGYGKAFGKLRFGLYDLDLPEVTDCAVQMFEEIVTLFPRAKGLVVEVEASGKEVAHRIPLYNRWAKQHGQPRFDKLCHPLECRVPLLGPWRDYTTERRIQLMRHIERAVRAKRYRGELAMLCETGWQPYAITQEVNLQVFGHGCPGWSAVSYECAYNKSRNRQGMMEMCVEEPRKAGLRTFYLPRGVMTWVGGMDGWPLPITLPQSWRLDLEDIARYQPEGVWWFGSGGLRDGIHVHPTRLRKVGYPTGRAARQALLRQVVRFKYGTDR
jgi:hypothetical protein